jgi:hypothetical protein
MDYAAFQITERRCKICMSGVRDEIDLMLLGETLTPEGTRYRYRDIVAWAQERGLEVAESSLSRHFHGHVQPGVRAMLETQSQMDAIAKATGKKLSLHSVFANVITGKILRLVESLEEADLREIDLDKLLRVAIMAGRNSLHIEKTERLLTEEAVKSVDEKLAKAGLDDETLRTIREELYGLSR